MHRSYCNNIFQFYCEGVSLPSADGLKNSSASVLAVCSSAVISVLCELGLVSSADIDLFPLSAETKLS